MPKIMLNGREYTGGGGSGTAIQEITRAEYDALSEEEKMRDVIYQITDEDSSNVIVGMVLGETDKTAFAGNRGKALEEKVNSMMVTVVGTLATGEKTLVLTDDAITENSVLDVYSSKYGVSPSNVVGEIGKVTLTFSKAQETDVSIKVIVINN